MAFFPGVAFPDAGEHFLRNLAVKPAYTVGFLTGVEREYAHGEAFVGVGVFASHVHEVVPRYAEFCGIFAHVFSEESFVEVVVTCGHRSVDGVKRRCADYFEGGVEIKPVFVDIIDEALEIEQGCVTFVAVIELAADAEFLEHQHAADTEKIFLLDAVLPVAAIELVGDRAVELAVHVEIGVEEIEFHAADVDTPYVAVDDASGVGHLEDHRLSVVVEHLLDGELVEVLSLIIGDLLTVDA